MDSDSSVDCVDCDGKIYRLKCDCCRSKRKENEYDFHPCKVANCTFSICWSCLYKWKDQSDKDITKTFECPQCHTEYDTELIEQHRPLSAALIQKVNNKAKNMRRSKKRRKKKREQDQKTKKVEMNKHKQLMRMRLEQERKRNKKKLAARKNAKPASIKTHVLNKHKVIVDFENNLILKQQWNEKMIHDIFGKIGPIATYEKTDSLIVTYRKAQSDKARRVLKYLFNLNVSICTETINKHNSTTNANDMFNANVSGGTQQFLLHRDKSTNWKEYYSIPKIDTLPPGCKRWIKDPPKRLTQQIFIQEMSKPRNNLVNNARSPQIIKTQRNKPIISVYPKPSNSASLLLPIQRGQMSAASCSMSDIKPIHDTRNGYNAKHGAIRNYKHAPAPPGIAPPGIAPPGIAPPGIGPPSIPPTIQRSASSYDMFDTKQMNKQPPIDNEWNELNDGIHNKRDAKVSKRNKIDNILRLKHTKKEAAQIGFNSLKWQAAEREEKKENYDEWQNIIVWECDNVRRDIQIVSDDDDLSDFVDYVIDKTVNGFKKDEADVYLNGNTHDDDDHHHEYDYDYDYSSEEEEIITPSFNALHKHANVEQIQLVAGTQQEEEEEKEAKSIENMTIQQMLDNLESFEPDQVEAILQKLLAKKQKDNMQHNEETMGNNNNNNNNNNEYDYDYDDDDSDDEVIENAFEITAKDANNKNASISANHDTSSASEEDERAQSKNGEIAKEKSKINHINAASLNMERHRSEMKKIAMDHKEYLLSQLPNIYFKCFQKNIKNVYNGKLKDLVRYFKDLFSMELDRKNQMNVCSKIYEKRNNKNAKRWTPKRKENKVDPSDFRHGPSMMYTIPRIAPKAHSHIIGTTAAVGTANAYSGSASSSPYARSGTNRFNTSNVRSYSSQRKGKRHKAYSDRKVKTYGDYEDNLPHTPSGSEDDDL